MPSAQAEVKAAAPTSATIQYLAKISGDNVPDINEPAEVRIAFGNALVDLAAAMDAGRIKFSDVNDQATLLCLLSLLGDIFFNGEFAAVADGSLTIQ